MNKSNARKSFFAYFITPKGQKLVLTGACITTVSLLVGNYVPYTFFLDKYKEIITCYRNAIEVPVSEKVRKRVEKALDILELEPYERKLIKPFTVYGFDIYQAGSTKYRSGAILGIPANYSYDSLAAFEKDKVQFRNKPINWDSETGKILQESLILTEEEQIFGICRAIIQLQTHQVLLNSLFPSVCFLMVYSVGNYLNQSLHLLARPLSMRFVLYSLLGLFGVGSWAFMKDYNQILYDSNTDKKLSDLGPECVQAGISFYDKILKKNIALRNLLGENTYTVKGNEDFGLRQKSLPLTARKAFFEMKLEEIQKTLDQASAESTLQ